MAEHRVGLGELGGAAAHRLHVGAERLRRPPPAPRRACGRNSCSGGSSRRMVTGSPAMMRNSSTKSSRWNGSSLASAARRPRSSLGHDHLPHRADALGIEEHVLGAAEADALGAELARGLRVERRLGVGAHAEPAASSAHSISLAKSPDSGGLDHRDGAHEHLAGGAVERDRLAGVHACARRPRASARRNRR